MENGRDAADRDAAGLLYGHEVGSLLVSLLASSGLVYISNGQVPSGLLQTWWYLMTAVLALRGIDILHFRKGRGGRNGRREIIRFGIGLTCTAALWAVFPLTMLSNLSQTGRACTAIVLSGMAGGSATVLAPSKILSAVFCAALVLPTSVLFLSFGGAANTFLGILGCMFFVVLLVSSRIANRATMTAIRLSRANEALLLGMEEQRQRTELANAELRAAQGALLEANQSLGSRIASRTAELEREMREKERYAQELAYLASTDSLTRLCNRGTLAARLKEALRRAEDAGESLAVLFLDLDKFKEVNDVLGHFAGDRVLQEVAQRLSSQLPGHVVLARWGGDEFVVAVPGVGGAGSAIHLGNALRECLSAPIETDVGVVRVDATVGIALFPAHGRSQEDLILAADVAMYASKEEKRAKIRLFDPSLSEQLAERHSIERALREAISRGALSLLFQPIIHVETGRCEALEALLRWDHPQRGAISPSVFIPLAERTGEIAALGEWALKRACLEAATWPGESPPCVSVNISTAQLESGVLIADILTALEEAKLPPSRLHLELTESVFAGDRNNVITVLSGLRERGVKISLDDFGTGFSCLAYLGRLPIDRIKIDRSFVERIHIDTGPIVKTIITTGQTFGLEIIGEGVETITQAETLIEMGAQFLQGYFFSNALSPEAAREWLSKEGASVAQKAPRLSRSASM